MKVDIEKLEAMASGGAAGVVLGVAQLKAIVADLRTGRAAQAALAGSAATAAAIAGIGQ